MPKDTTSQTIRKFLRRPKETGSSSYQSMENARWFLEQAQLKKFGDKLRCYDFAIANLLEALRLSPSRKARAELCDILSAAYTTRGLTRQNSCSSHQHHDNEDFVEKLSYMADLNLSYQYLLERNRILKIS